MADVWGSMWFSVLISLVPFALCFGLLLWRWSRLACPECGTRAPLLISPFAKTRRHWAEGGWTCAACGTDVDVRGRKVAPGVGPRPGWLIRSVLLLVAAVAVAAIGLYVGVARIRHEPEPPLAPESPREAPAVAAPVPPAGRDLQ